MPTPAATTDENKQTFLDALARSGVIGTACRAAGITRPTAWRWRKDDALFDAAFLDAMADASDELEQEARRRAYEGVSTEKIVGTGDNARTIVETRYSDTLMLALLKAKKPDEFADRSKTEFSNPDGTMRPENPENAAVRLAAILDEARRRRDNGEAPEDDDDDLFA